MPESVVRPLSVPLWQSRESGDIVLASTPPYMLGGWLPMGIPLIGTLLEQVGITSRVVRFQDAPSSPSPDIVDLIYMTLYGDPPLAQRLDRIRAVAAREAAFFELVLSRLLAGPERIFGLSAWRMNADVTLEVARQLKEQRPDALIVIGGPETSESTSDFFQEWVDVVVWGSAASVVVPVMRALLDRQPGEAAVWDNVWVNPKHERRGLSAAQHGQQPPLPHIDYTDLVPLQVGATHPMFPLMLNLGCPFRCGFCPNTTIYPDLAWGNPERVVEEMVEIMRVWEQLHPDGDTPRIELQLCDAALNANPAQYDRLCRALIDADWPGVPPSIGSLLVIDERMTPERARLTREAGLHNGFFGLESANPRLRRLMKKPGGKKEIAAALKVCRDEGFTSLGMGVIVGWPDETEEEFYETVEFLDWAVSLGVSSSLCVMPLIRTPGMMDPTLLEGATGEARGLLWKMPTAGGSPNVRARRFFHVMEHFNGLVTVASSVPHEIVARSMINESAQEFWSGWMARHSVEDVDAARHLVANFWGDRADSAAALPIVEATAPPSDDTSAAIAAAPLNTPEPREASISEGGAHDAPAEPPASERTLVGRGEAVVLRLDPQGTPGFAKVYNHTLSYRGSDIPEPLRHVVLNLGRVVSRLPKEPAPTDDVWRDIDRIVRRIAPDVCLND